MPIERLKSALDQKILRILTQPPKTLTTKVSVIVGTVLGIGVIDYLSGVWISMQVFYLVPISFAVAWIGFFAAILTSICCILVRVGGDYSLGAPYAHHPTIIWNSLVFFATYMMVAWGIYLLVNFQRELEARVAARTTALAREVQAREQLQTELVELSERERRTIGNDLHDGLGQHLTAMAYAAEILNRNLAAQQHPAATSAEQLVRLAEDGIQQSRQLARGLLLSAIEPENLNRELEELASTIQQQSGVRCYYESASTKLVADSTTASHVFRIAQEAVRNSIRHANPTSLNLSLREDGETLILEVKDNGMGMPLEPQTNAGVGLQVMEQRAKLIGGQFSVESTSGRGTRVQCRIPLQPKPSGLEQA